MAVLTAKNIYELASSFLYERDGDDEDSKRFCLGYLNIMLQETLAIENSIRRSKKRTELEEAPYLTALSDVVPYDGALTRVAFPYGMAYYFYKEGMDNYTAAEYKANYVDACASAAKVDNGVVHDAHGGSQND